jgi:hypothetical protein
MFKELWELDGITWVLEKHSLGHSGGQQLSLQTLIWKSGSKFNKTQVSMYWILLLYKAAPEIPWFTILSQGAAKKLKLSQLMIPYLFHSTPKCITKHGLWEASKPSTTSHSTSCKWTSCMWTSFICSPCSSLLICLMPNLINTHRESLGESLVCKKTTQKNGNLATTHLCERMTKRKPNKRCNNNNSWFWPKISYPCVGMTIVVFWV